MGLFESQKRVWAEALSKVSYCNPFLPERIELERVILDDKFIDSGVAWHKRADEVEDRPNIDLLTVRSKELADWARTQIEDGATLSEEDVSLYEDVVLYYFYNNGAEEMLLGSADLMPRNLDRRVETLFPIEDEKMLHAIRDKILRVHLKDNVQCWHLLSDGSYERCATTSENPPLNSQMWMIGHRGIWDRDT